MQGRALLMVGLFFGVTAFPAVAAVGEAETCVERMLRELGWDQPEAPAGQAYDMLPTNEPLIPPEDDLHACVGKIQPGSLMTGVGCTMNWILSDQLGRLYFGTAGHCVGAVGQTFGVSNVGNNLAMVVYDGYKVPGDVPDFALLRIDPAFYADVDPTLCHWGGPAGVQTAASFGMTTHIYGYGLIYGSTSVTRPRVGVVNGVNPSEIVYTGFAQPGDSGAPVATGDGKAAGIHVRSSLSVPGYSIRIDPSPKYMTRLDVALAQAEAATGLDLSLVDGTEPFNLAGY